MELLALNSILINLAAGNPAASAPAALDRAQLQVKQEVLTDTSDQLARRVDMNSHALTFPLPYFCQQETQVNNIPAAANQSVSLTGFRAGEVKQIVLWFTPTTLGGAPNAQTPGSGNYQPLNWSQLTDIQLLYNGEVFSRFDNVSWQLWNVVEDQKVSQVGNYTNFTAVGTNTNSAAIATSYVKCDFAQVSMPSERQSVLVHGKPVMNSIVTLQFSTAVAGTLHAMYIYNASLLLSRGSAEYIF